MEIIGYLGAKSDALSVRHAPRHPQRQIRTLLPGGNAANSGAATPPIDALWRAVERAAYTDMGAALRQLRPCLGYCRCVHCGSAGGLRLPAGYSTAACIG